MNTRYIKSPNFSDRKGQKVLGVCIHITDGDTGSVISEFTSPRTQKSAHYLVTRSGDVIQFVDERKCAWSQGLKVRPTAKLVLERLNENPNDYLVSIEHEAFANQDLTEIQYVTSGKLLGEICRRWTIPLDQEHVIKHNSIRQDKSCPGIISISKLIGLAQNPPQISEILEIQIKLSLLQKLLELMRTLANYRKLGSNDSCSLDK